jgi:hypothetical protein
MQRVLRLVLVVCSLQIAFSAGADPTHDECTSFRLPRNCSSSQVTSARQKLTREGKLEFKTTVRLPSQSFEQPAACNARVSISYMQMNEKVRVDTTVVNEDCVVSTGDYTLFVRTIDEAGEAHTRNITESWVRKTAAPIELTQDYDLGSDVGLLSVNVRTSKKTACTCVDGEGTDPSEVENP